MTEASPDDLLSIGRLAEESGVAAPTIRMWERRYGRPQPVRLPSGHRRYTWEQVRWMRRVAEAMALGHRASVAVRAADAQLGKLLASAAGRPEPSSQVRALLDFAGAFDSVALVESLEDAARALGPRAFVEDVVGPFLRGIGRAWAEGELTIAHEHLASQCVEEVLRSVRRSLPPPVAARPVILATLPEELHGLGLHMVDLVCRFVGRPSHMLGPNTPIDEIARAARDTNAAGVVVSVSIWSGGPATDRALRELRGLLPATTRFVAGGRGAGVEHVEGFEQFENWIRALGSETDREAAS